MDKIIKVKLVTAEQLAKSTALTVPEIEILRKNGVFWMRYDPAHDDFRYDENEILEVVKTFDRLIVTRDGLDPELGYKIEWPFFDALYPGEGQIKPVGQDWITGRALFRFSDILAWRKKHHIDVMGVGIKE